MPHRPQNIEPQFTERPERQTGKDRHGFELAATEAGYRVLGNNRDPHHRNEADGAADQEVGRRGLCLTVQTRRTNDVHETTYQEKYCNAVVANTSVLKGDLPKYSA